MIQNEIRSKQSKSNSISCPTFFPVVNELVNPGKDLHRNSSSKSHSKQKKSSGALSPKSTFSDFSLDDSLPVTPKSTQYSIKLESITSVSPRSDYSVSSPKSPQFSFNYSGRAPTIKIEPLTPTSSPVLVYLYVLFVVFLQTRHRSSLSLSFVD